MSAVNDNPVGPIIPPEAAPLRSLTVTMTVMCYLACLAIGALIVINRAVDNWTGGLLREVTVQVRQVQGADMDTQLRNAEDVLKAFPGIIGAETLGQDAGARLLEPWLGNRNLDDLPIPRLIRVTVDPGSPPDYPVLEAALQQAAPGARLDTHRRWQGELTRMARTLSTLSWAILILICVSAIAMVIFATRTVLHSNSEVVDVLHLIGARDGYIARQIDSRFLKTGLWAGLIGVALGVLTFFFLSLTGSPGTGGIADASRGLLFAPAGSALRSYLALLAVPLVATIICLLTSRITLVRMLGSAL